MNASVRKHPLLSASACWLLAVVALALLSLLAGILWLGEGAFFYSLDLAYTRLTLAAHIAQGGYGLNSGEFSSPVSSALWPFLLAPFAGFSWAYFVPLAINVAACMGTALVAHDTLKHVYPRLAPWLAFALLALTNVIGLAFTGLEHSLQVFLAVAVMGALIGVTEGRKAPRWLMAALIIAPLIRYEMLSVTLAATALLLWHRHYRYLIGAAGMGIVLGGFSYFLWQHSGAYVPASVTVRLAEFREHPDNVAALLALIVFTVIGAASFRKSPARLVLFAYVLAVMAAQFLWGRSGWFSRYEIYAVAPGLLMVLYYAPSGRWFKWQDEKPLWRKAVTILMVLAALKLAQFYFYTYTVATLATPGAAHALQLQQGEMRRLLQEADFPAVAVNDIGYIGYQNPAYVFDLYGLGVVANQKQRRGDIAGWFASTAKRDVAVVMFHTSWFPDSIVAKRWVKLGTLKLWPFDGLFISPLAGNEVSVYATSKKEAVKLKPALLRWSETLRENAVWEAEEK